MEFRTHVSAWPTPGYRRWSVRLAFLLLIPVAAALLHLALARWFPGPVVNLVCVHCGVRYRVVQVYAFGLTPVGLSRSLEETDCSGFLRELLGIRCSCHEWAPDHGTCLPAAGNLLAFVEANLPPGDCAMGPILPATCRIDLITRWNPATTRVLDYLTRIDADFMRRMFLNHYYDTPSRDGPTVFRPGDFSIDFGNQYYRQLRWCEAEFDRTGTLSGGLADLIPPRGAECDGH